VASLNGQVSRFVGDTPSPCTTGGDTTPPQLDAEAPRRQDADRKIKVQVTSAEAAAVTARLRVVAGGDTIAKPKKKTVDVAPGDTAKVAWKLDGADRRAVRRAAGKPTARFTARGRDASGNRSRAVRASSKLSG
jgi:hypothetical protein